MRENPPVSVCVIGNVEMKNNTGFLASERELPGFLFMAWLYHELDVVSRCSLEAKKSKSTENYRGKKF